MSIFDKHKKDIVKVIDQFPRKAAVIARKHFDQSFTNKGFTDKKLTRWKPVKDHRKGRTGNKKQPLVKTGRLRSSIRTKVQGNTAIIFTSVPYAAIHNDGTEVIVKQHTRKVKGKAVNVKSHKRVVAQRQFMGESEVLDKKLTQVLVKDLQNVFK